MSKVGPCGIYGLSSVSEKCGEWIYYSCAGVKRVIAKVLNDFAKRKENIGTSVEQEE